MMTTTRTMPSSLSVLHIVLEALDVAIPSGNPGEYAPQSAVYLGQRGAVDMGYRFGWYPTRILSPNLANDYHDLAEAVAIGETVGGLRWDPAQARRKLRAVVPLFTAPKPEALSREEWTNLLASVDYLRVVSKIDGARADDVIREQRAALFPYLADAKAALRQYGFVADRGP